MEEKFETGRVFLLSPANVAGKRAKMLLNPKASFELARRLRTGDGVPLGEAFAFMSGLYFRGKLAYARAFAQAPDGCAGVLIITTNRGLISADALVTSDELQAYSDVPIDARDERYTKPLIRDAVLLAASCAIDCSIVLLGSVASGKYVDHLLPVFGKRLHFPKEFVGRGDMSRGGILLRSVTANRMLTHIPVAGTVRRGSRQPKLTPLSPKPKIRGKPQISQMTEIKELGIIRRKKAAGTKM
jgi:hypothetical protein